MELIDKTALVAEIEKRIKEIDEIGTYLSPKGVLTNLLCHLDTLEVKEVDLEKEIETHLKDCLDVKFPTIDIELIKKDVTYTAKKFFELGMMASNPITATDRGMVGEIIINLKRVEQDYCIDLTKEMEWLRSKVKKGK